MEAHEIKALFAKFGANLDNNDVWKVQQATVLKHKALERLAVAAGIRFDAPTIIRAERDEAVILAVGRLGDVSEWSIGEALIDMNYRVSGKQAGYVYAMAEKRAKDRVILKLAGLHGLYSEDEADEFKESAPAPGRNAPGRNAPPSNDRTSNDGGAPLTVTERLIAALDGFTDAAAIFAWRNNPKVHEAYSGLSDAAKQSVDAAQKRRLEIIESPFQEAAE